MNTSYSFNQTTLELTISKAFEKNASVYGTEEYKTILNLRRDYPNLRIFVKTQKAAEKKADDKLTYPKMRGFIKLCRDADERLVTFDRVLALSKCQRSPYAYVKHWFLENYANYNCNPELKEGYVIPKTRAEMEAEKAQAAQTDKPLEASPTQETEE